MTRRERCSQTIVMGWYIYKHYTGFLLLVLFWRVKEDPKDVLTNAMEKGRHVLCENRVDVSGGVVVTMRKWTERFRTILFGRERRGCGRITTRTNRGHQNTTYVRRKLQSGLMLQTPFEEWRRYPLP